MKWSAVRSVAKNQKSHRRVNLLHQESSVFRRLKSARALLRKLSGLRFGVRRCSAAFPFHCRDDRSPIRRHGDTRPPGTQAFREIGKELVMNALDQNVDLAGATETAARIKRQNNRLAGLQNFARAF